MIAPELFPKAQEIMRTRRQQRTGQEAIARPAAIGREKGHLATAIIAAADNILSAESYRRRFGSPVAAYELAGYQPEPRQRLAQNGRSVSDTSCSACRKIVEQVNRLGGRAMIDPDGLLCVNDECRISLGSARAVNYVSDRVRWRIHADPKANSDLSLIVRMDASNTESCLLLASD